MTLVFLSPPPQKQCFINSFSLKVRIFSYNFGNLLLDHLSIWKLFSNYFFKTGGLLLYNVVLVFAVKQHKSIITIYISSLLSLPSIPPANTSRLSQSARLSSLCYTAASRQLSIYMWSCICVSATISARPTCCGPKSLLYVCVSVSFLQIDSSVSSF